MNKAPPTPAPMPASRFDAAADVDIAVVFINVLAVSFGLMELDVRLKIIELSSIENGAVLPLVLVVQAFLDGSAWPQQKRFWLIPWRNKGYIHCPLVRPTAKVVLAHLLAFDPVAS